MGDVTLRDIQPQKQTVFETVFKDERVYRIPALVYERESKTLLAFAERRKTKDDTSGTMLVMRKGTLKDESKDKRTIEWEDTKDTEVKEAHMDGYRPMNPCPVYDENTKKLFLFFICVEGTVTEMWQRTTSINKTCLCYITSEDFGKNWTKMSEVKEKKEWVTFAVGPGHGLQMTCGRLIVPVYAYINKDNSRAFALYSDDSGKTWKFGQMLQTDSVECEMTEVFDDKNKSFIYCNARNLKGYRVEAVSNSNGDDFTEMKGGAKLIETGYGCQGSVVPFPAQSEDGNTKGDKRQNQNKWLLFTHPSDKKRRIDLGVYLNKSPRDRTAWGNPWVINSGPSGYSDLAYIGDGWFACLMECGEKTEIEQIASVVFNYNSVKQGIEQSTSGKCQLCCF